MLDYRRRGSLAQLSLPNLLDFPLITGRRIPSVFFLLFPPANFWPTLVPTLTERVTATKFCGRVARNCNKGRMLKFRSETDGFAFRTSPRLTMTIFLEIVECFDPDTKSIGYEVMF